MEISVPKEQLIREHTVKPGEYLYQIIRSYGVLEEDIPKVVELTSMLNPDIADLNKLSPGQKLEIPLSASLDLESKKPASPQKVRVPSAGDVDTRFYTVRPGDRLVHIMRHELGLPDNLIFNEYLNLFRELNPGVDNVETILAGSRIILPVPPEGLDLASGITLAGQPLKPGETDQVKTSELADPPRIPWEEIPPVEMNAVMLSALAQQRARAARSAPREPQSSPESRAEPDSETKAEGPPSPTGRPLSRNYAQDPGLPETGEAESKQDSAEAPPRERLRSYDFTREKTRKPQMIAAIPKQTANATAADMPEKQRQMTEPTPPKPAPINDMDRKTYVLDMLKTMGFAFTPGNEILFPLNDGNWLRLNLLMTPICTAPWGKSYLLSPPNFYTEKQIEQIASLGFVLCGMPGNWDPAKVIAVLEEKSRGQIRLWDPERPLILKRSNVVFDLKAQHIVQLRTAGKARFFMFNLLSYGQDPMPNLLRAFLAKQDLTLREWSQKPGGGIRPVSQAWPSANSIMVPQVAGYSAWTDLRALLGEEALNFDPPREDLESVLAALNERGMTMDTSLHISWREGQVRAVSLTVPAKLIQVEPEPLALLNPAQADPYLFSLLSLKGYRCATIKW